jgi:putative heme iron utilization protein
MLSRLEILIDLLHGAGDAALASQSLAMPGFPFASAVPFAPDELHRPILLISRLAEHTQNLAADARASLLLSRPLGEGEMARVTLIGTVVPIEAGPDLVARYLRYHPEAERFLQLGDFTFHRLEPARIRVIGGFAQAGWLEGERLLAAASLAHADAARLWQELAPLLPAGAEWLGIDAYGADLRLAGEQRRLRFPGAPLDAAAIGRDMPAILAALR